MYAYVWTANINNLAPKTIKVEVAGYNGLPGIKITGLPDTVVKESFYRISTAFRSCKIELPLKRFVINFIPADVPKKGAGFDLPIAAAILKAIGVIPVDAFNDYILYGELSLTGELRFVTGVLPIINHAAGSFEKVIIPLLNADEAAFFKERTIPIKDLHDLIKLSKGEFVAYDIKNDAGGKEKTYRDLSDVVGQPLAIRAAEIAATGRHHMLLIGSPGCGKSMIGERIPGIMPPLTEEEKLEVNSIYSIAGLLGGNTPTINTRPFRSPHHTISDSALIGGQRIGEISLAHKGVLFLDELSEFKYNVLNALREPLEKGSINISRANYHNTMPADFLLVAASNPCDCGNLLKKDGSCKCSTMSLQRFNRRLNGPLMDRFDIKVVMSPPKVKYAELCPTEKPKTLSTEEIRKRVITANAFLKELKSKGLKQKLSEGSRTVLDRFIASSTSSIRQVRKIINLSRTIAALDNKENITDAEMLEAINYSNAFNRS
jgi:magnesium chelatase family protein